MKWALIAIVAGQPVPTGVTYDAHLDCVRDAGIFVSQMALTLTYIEKDSVEARGQKHVVAPEYACIPKKGHKP